MRVVFVKLVLKAQILSKEKYRKKNFLMAEAATSLPLSLLQSVSYTDLIPQTKPDLSSSPAQPPPQSIKKTVSLATVSRMLVIIGVYQNKIKISNQLNFNCID